MRHLQPHVTNRGENKRTEHRINKPGDLLRSHYPIRRPVAAHWDELEKRDLGAFHKIEHWVEYAEITVLECLE